MKKILLTSIFISLLIFPLVGYSQSQYLEEIPSIPILGPGGAIAKVTNILFTLLVLGAVISFIYAGFLFVTSSGDPQKFDTAKKAVLYGVIGLLIAFSSWGIVKLVKTIFGVEQQQESPEWDPLDPGGEMGPW
ncbi:pilin [Patescibacteria group bacterium]|nr:pilin [Patescibacteria group bacterium]